MQVPCGNCIECRESKRNQLATRLSVHSWQVRQQGGTTLFLTFSYNNAHLPHILYRDNAIPAFSRRDVKQFLKALRRYYNKRGKSFTYILVCEYGKNTQRPHYHMMPFLPKDIDPTEFAEKCREYWTHMYVKEKDIYVNNGYMFPSKTDVKRGKHIVNHSKSCAYYASKYATKDLSFFGLPFIAEIVKNPELKEVYKNYLPHTYLSPNIGWSWFHDYLVNNPAATKCTNPCTGTVVNIPDYAINKYCYDCYRGDELNSKGQRKTIRELNDAGFIRRKIILMNLIEKKLQVYKSYGYDNDLSYKMAVYHYIYRGFTTTQMYNIIDENKKYGISLFDGEWINIMMNTSLWRYPIEYIPNYKQYFVKKIQIGYDKKEFKPIMDEEWTEFNIFNTDLSLRYSNYRYPSWLLKIAYCSELVENDLFCNHKKDVEDKYKQLQQQEELHVLTHGVEKLDGNEDNCYACLDV